MKTPQEWCEETGIRILDPDGWREDGKDWNEPVEYEEWERRMVRCTVNVSQAKGKWLDWFDTRNVGC